MALPFAVLHLLDDPPAMQNHSNEQHTIEIFILSELIDFIENFRAIVSQWIEQAFHIIKEQSYHLMCIQKYNHRLRTNYTYISRSQSNERKKELQTNIHTAVSQFET